jgi:DNA polymerase III gamma/tau subunit
MTEQLINRYRPTSFDEVFGHEAIIRSLRSVVSEPGRPHGYLLTGPAGVGKTSIGRIIGTTIGVPTNEISDCDAATNRGIDDIRKIQTECQYLSLTGNPKFLLIDECHQLTTHALSACLKFFEEPPPHVYFALCTTEPDKLPQTIRSRCHPVPLQRLSEPEIGALIDKVCTLEGWQLNDDVFILIIEAANGQPREALRFLEACRNAQSRQEAECLIDSVSGEGDAKQLIYAIMNKSLQQAVYQLSIIKEDAYDSVLVHMGRYLCSVIDREKRDLNKINWAFQKLEALTFPTFHKDPKTVLYAAVRRMLLDAEQ